MARTPYKRGSVEHPSTKTIYNGKRSNLSVQLYLWHTITSLLSSCGEHAYGVNSAWVHQVIPNWSSGWISTSITMLTQSSSSQFTCWFLFLEVLQGVWICGHPWCPFKGGVWSNHWWNLGLHRDRSISRKAITCWDKTWWSKHLEWWVAITERRRVITYLMTVHCTTAHLGRSMLVKYWHARQRIIMIIHSGLWVSVQCSLNRLFTTGKIKRFMKFFPISLVKRLSSSYIYVCSCMPSYSIFHC